MTSRTICIVTSAHISYNPRALKEADALHEAGFDVRVFVVMHNSKRRFWMMNYLSRGVGDCARIAVSSLLKPTDIEAFYN